MSSTARPALFIYKPNDPNSEEPATVERYWFISRASCEIVILPAPGDKFKVWAPLVDVAADVKLIVPLKPADPLALT